MTDYKLSKWTWIYGLYCAVRRGTAVWSNTVNTKYIFLRRCFLNCGVCFCSDTAKPISMKSMRRPGFTRIGRPLRCTVLLLLALVASLVALSGAIGQHGPAQSLSFPGPICAAGLPSTASVFSNSSLPQSPPPFPRRKISASVLSRKDALLLRGILARFLEGSSTPAVPIPCKPPATNIYPLPPYPPPSLSGFAAQAGSKFLAISWVGIQSRARGRGLLQFPLDLRTVFASSLVLREGFLVQAATENVAVVSNEACSDYSDPTIEGLDDSQSGTEVGFSSTFF